MKNQYCAECGDAMQGWGRTTTGKERYRCPRCGTSRIIHRPDTHLRHDHDRLVAWLTGVESKEDVAQRYGVTRRALSKEFRRFFRQNPNGPDPKNLTAKLLIVDAKFIHGDELCALIAVDEHDRIFWQFASDECYGTWYGFLVRFAPPDIVVADGHKGMSRFVKRHWPHTAFQRCHFHMVSLVIHYLSRNPKEQAGRDILELAYQLKHIATKEEREHWRMLHRIWEKQYEKVFAEKTPSGEYAHRKLRSVRGIVRRALPDLFTYLDFPRCPNTTNLVEGWVNTALAEGLRRHRGLRLRQKKTLVSVILSHLRREKPTRKFP
ncbi:MAG: transposase [Candidatus Liptonbacteria bacterium]|nr:transposase [Candidatus Liptonbacteria bacterium]